jgi:hypothetical protein
MSTRYQSGLRWVTAIAVVVTLWWGWQLQRERAVLQNLTRTATDVRQRIAHARAEIAHVHRADRGTLDSLARATQTLHGVVGRLQRQELTVTLTCQEPTTLTVATLPLVARRCHITLPPTSLLAVIEVIHAVEQTQVLLPRVRVHVTEGMTMDVHVIGPEESTRPQTIWRETE